MRIDNPSQFLKDYLARHHPSLTLSPTRPYGREHGVELTASARLRSGLYEFTIMLPRNAPANPRPLCTKVLRNKESLWYFGRGEQRDAGFMRKVRVHLYEFSDGNSRIFLLVKVQEGEPDLITEVRRVDGTYLSDSVEALLKLKLGKLWGMKYRLTAAEKQVVKELMPKKTSS